ncbi:MAG: hypothetical protein P1U67_00825 [Alcanivoracaceae bacterium]|nr:hypothetical protein [Alcanivoracaceae bacterium]
MSNSEVFLKQIMDTVNAKGLLAETEVKEKLFIARCFFLQHANLNKQL